MPNESQTIAESRALTAALSAIEGTKTKEEALVDVRVFREESIRDPSIEGAIIDTALWAICGKAEKFEAPEVILKDRSLNIHLFESLADIWITWAIAGVHPASKQRLSQLRLSEKPRGSTFHSMALQEWQLAIEALHEKNTEEARKRYKRAMKLGAEYGTPSNPVVHWTYAASFFHEG